MPNEQIQRMGKILDQVEVPCLILDVVHHTVVYANPAAATAPLLAAKPCYELLHGLDSPCDQHGIRCPIAEIQRTRDSVCIEHMHRQADGSQRVFEVLAHPIFDSVGSLTHIFEFEIDVTDLREIESRRARAEASLDIHAEALLLLDPQDRLVIRNQRAHETYPELRFGSGTKPLETIGSLDLSTLRGQPTGSWQRIYPADHPRRLEATLVPLAHEQGKNVWHLLLLRENELPSGPLIAPGDSSKRIDTQLPESIQTDAEEAKDAAEEIVASERTLRQSAARPKLVRQILDFGRHSSSRSDLVDLHPLVARQAGLVDSSRCPGVQVSFATPPRPFTVLGDASQLEQVLANLTENACNAIEESGRVLYRLEDFDAKAEDASCRRGMWPGKWLRLSVEDTGHGIREEARSHIFRPFFSTRPPNQGAGMGLAQAYGLVKKHGGFIELQSEVGKGTCFEVYLPRFDRDDCPEIPLEKIRASPGRILVVDDEEALLRRFEKILSYTGHEVLGATSGKEALELLDRQDKTVDVCLVSQFLPDFEEDDLLSKICEVAQGVSGILMTREGSSSAQEHCFGSMLKRPFTACELLASVEVARENP